MFDLGKVECTTALEVELLAALVYERRLRSRREAPPTLKKSVRPRLVFLQPPAENKSEVGQVTIPQIQAAIAEQFKVSVHDLRSCRRDAWVTMARHAAAILCHLLTPHSYPTIGRMFGHRDHTSMMYAVRKYEAIKVDLGNELSKEDPLQVWVTAAFEKIMVEKALNRTRKQARYHELVA